MTQDRYLVLYWIAAGSIRTGTFVVADDNHALLSWIDAHRASIIDGSTIIDQITRVSEPLQSALTRDGLYNESVTYLSDDGSGKRLSGFVTIADAQALIYRRGTFTVAVRDPYLNKIVYVDSTQVDLVI